MSTYEEISENLTAQVYELEALQSVYPKELVIGDHGVLAHINEFIKNPMNEVPQKLEYSIEISLNDGSIELLISLSSNYPKEKPEIYARSSFLNRSQQLLLNQSLNDILKQQKENEPCIYMLISWLQDNGENYLTESNKNKDKKLNNKNKNKEHEKPTNFSRYWIYSHHIYRKPGVICLEGALEDCVYCWQKIKSMNWQKILLQLEEREEDCENIDEMRKFSNFQEISFNSSGRHNDMGQLLKYLMEHTLQYAFKELFGISGKSTQL